MHLGYSSDELKNLARILNDILLEARTHHPDLSTDEVVQRVCALADRGERDAKKMRQEVLGSRKRTPMGPVGKGQLDIGNARRKLRDDRVS